MRNLVLAAAAFAVSTPAGLYALGLGEIKLHSALNQPLNAEIELLSVRKQDLPSLQVALAPEDAFGRAGIDRSHLLTLLKFELLPGNGGTARVRVTSREPIREPFLNFIVEADWSNGSLLREYTLLLDPPELMSAPPAVVEAPRASAPVPAAKAASSSTAEESLPPPGSKVTSFGPTRANYTLWRIALRLRPDESISVQQMMLALLRANPEAFNGDNVNGLKTGYVLRVPGAAEARRLSIEQAMAEVKRQHTAWKTFVAGGGLNAEAAPIQRGATAAPVQPTATRGELKLTSSKKAAAPVPGAGGTAEKAPAEVLRDELAVASEAAASRERENEELLVRIDELEGQIGDLKSLITMKNEQLAALQNRLKAGETASPAESPAPAGDVAAAAVSTAESPAAESATGAGPAETPIDGGDGSAVGGAPEADSAAEPPAAAGDLALIADAAGDLTARIAAAGRLGDSGSAEAVAPLSAVLAGDEPWTLRRAAAEALGKLGGSGAVDALLPALAGDAQPMVRREAAIALGRIKDPRSVEGLENALADEATVETEVDGKIEPRLVVSEAAEEALIAIDMARQQAESEAPPTAPAPAQPAPAERPAPVQPAPAAEKPATPPAMRAPAPPPAEPAGFVIPFLDDPLLLGGGVGVVLLLLGGLVLVARRRRAAAGEEVPDEVAAASVAAALASVEGGAEPSAGGDPIAEADVYLDIGQYQKAEDLLKGAITREPGRHELKLKLLEIYFAAKSVAPFEALAGQLRGELGGGDAAVWNRVREMGAQLSPASVLFAAGAVGASTLAPAGGEPEVELELPDSFDLDIDLGIGEEGAVADGLDADLALPEGVEEVVSRGADAAGEEVDFDLTLPGGNTLGGATEEEPLVHDEGHVLDFDLTDLGALSAGGEAPAVEEAAADQGNLVDFDLTIPGGDLVDTGREEAPPVHDAEHVLDFDLGLDDTDMGPSLIEEVGEGAMGGLDFDLTLPGGEEGADEGTVVLDMSEEETSGETAVAPGLDDSSVEEGAMSLDPGMDESAEEEVAPLDLG
ncbi:FimV/HubP family polar landmark protein, partial [Endothiovibrio diazotrophicus]